MTVEDPLAMPRRFRGRVAIWVAVLLAGVAGFVLPSTLSRSAYEAPPQKPQAGFEPVFSRDHGPLLQGKAVTLDEAERMVSFPILRPQHALANDALIKAVFVEVVPDDAPDTVGEQVVVDYQSGVVLYLDLAEARLADDPLGELEAELEELPSQARLTEVLGVPALAIPSVTDAGKDAAGMILVVDRLRVVVQARYAPLDWDVLVDVAATLTTD